MMKRFLIAVVLQLLTLNISVHASLRVILAGNEDVPSVRLDHEQSLPGHHDFPPVEEDAHDAPMPESEDDVSYAHSGSIAVLIPIFSYYSFVHPDQHALEGTASCLMKPPPIRFF